MALEPITRQEKIIAGQDLTPITRMEKFLKNFGGGGGGVQSDWNQNDETAADYVKNRPFYTGDPVETVLVEESTATFQDWNGMYGTTFSSTFEATVRETYKVSWDGTVYECTCVDDKGHPVIGNLSIVGSGSDTGEPFFMDVLNGNSIDIYTLDTSASHTFSISQEGGPEVVRINQKYLPKAALITYDSSAGTYSSDLTNDELYETMLNGWQVVLYDSTGNSYYYLTKWIHGSSGRIDLIFDGGNLKISLLTDGTIGTTPIG